MNIDEAIVKPRFIPKDSIEVKDPASSAVVYTYTVGDKPCGVAYAGKGSKPNWHYRYKDAETLNKKIEEFFKQIQEYEKYKRENDRRKVSPRDLNVGDILTSTWGYSMTIVDYYQVISLVGNSSAVIRKLNQRTVRGDDGFSGETIPVKDSFTGPDIRVRISGDSCKVNGHTASKWNGLPRYFNHLD